MKAEELMVGDFLRFRKVEPLPDNYVKIHAIKYDYQFVNDYLFDIVFLRSGLIQYNYSLRSFEPIPLTPEILEKNGFENDFYEDVSVADYHSIRVEGYSLRGKVDDWDDYLVSYCNGSVCVVTDFHGEVKKEMCYVHELQHALRLCGIDKEIVL